MYKNIEEIRTALFCGKRIYDIPLRVTFYGRVSTDEDKQLNSLEHQIAYFESKIKSCEKWEYVPGYIDAAVIIGLKTLRLKKCQKHAAF